VEVSVVNDSFQSSISKNLMKVPYEKVEDPIFITKKDTAVTPITQYGTIHGIISAIPKVVQAFFTIFTLSIVLSRLNIWIFVMIFAVTIISFMMNTMMMKVETREAKTSPKGNRIYVYYLRMMRSKDIAKDVRIYHMTDLLMRKIRTLFNDYIESGTSLYRAIDLRALVNRFSSIVLMILLYGFLFVQLMDGLIDIPLFILFANASLAFSDQLFVLMNEIITHNKHYAYIKDYFVFKDEMDEARPTGTIILNEPIHTIELDNISFAYPHAQKEVLSNVNAEFDLRKSYALVGKNASGKTTLIKLIARLYEPTKGRILVNGINIKEYEINSYYKQLSITFQDFKVFSTTIKENISFLEHDDDQFDKAIDQSELKVELHKFANGVDTPLSKDAKKGSVSLSMGQEQKIAIARSVFRDGSLMILDEPTASLDPIAEETVYQHFKEITQDKLTLFISHRLSSCRFSDQILFLKEGQITEKGSHNELMSLKGDYESMFTLQGSQYQE
jgi:ABC-type multidrug transport system fused ATPase/permease subunit